MLKLKGNLVLTACLLNTQLVTHTRFDAYTIKYTPQKPYPVQTRILDCTSLQRREGNSRELIVIRE